MTEPCNQCWEFFRKHQRTADESVEELTKKQFDELARDNEFAEGPFKESFGDGYGEPYHPHRQVFGLLKDGQVVFAELAT